MCDNKQSKRIIRGISQADLTSAIAVVGYDIIDNIICALVSIEGVMADLYLASPSDYLISGTEEETSKLFNEYKKRIVTRYGLKDGEMGCFEG